MCFVSLLSLKLNLAVPEATSSLYGIYICSKLNILLLIYVSSREKTNNTLGFKILYSFPNILRLTLFAYDKILHPCRVL